MLITAKTLYLIFRKNEVQIFMNGTARTALRL